MPSELFVLAEGYARPDGDGGYFAAPATVLIIDNGKRVLADPGAEPDELLDVLRKRGLAPADIDLVFLTHHHADHWQSLYLFPGVSVCDGRVLYQGNRQTAVSGVIPGTQIEILPTPGHCEEHAALLVKTARGRYAVAGDVFWWPDGAAPQITAAALLGLADPFAEDMDRLRQSRSQLLNAADFIIPGHGAVFAVPRPV